MTTIADLVVSVGADIAGYTKGMDTVDNRIDTVSKSVTSSLDNMGKSFVSVGKSATLLGAPFAGLAALAVKAASDSEKAISQFDAVLKSTEATMTTTAATAGHWADVTKASGDNVEVWKDQLDSATERLSKLQAKQAAGISLTEAENKSIGTLTSQIGSYQNALSGATSTQKVWVAGTAAAASISHLARQEYLDMATALQKVTLFDDEAILGAESLLLTFTNIGKDVFPDATKAVLDMSQALGQDLKSSSVQLGKALNDPILGITALSRVGVSFTEQQKNQIKALATSGKMMEAQQLILAELQKEFGGSAEAAGKTFAGSITILTNRIGDLLEKLGDRLIPIIQFFIGIIDKVVTVFESASEPVQTVIAAIVALGAALGTVGPVLIGIGVVLQTEAVAGLVAFGGALLAAVAPILIIGAALAGLAYIASKLVNFDELGKIIGDGLADALNQIKDLTGFDAMALVNSIRDKIATAFGAKPLFGPEMGTGASGGQDALTKYAIQKGDTLYDIAKKYGTSVDALKKANDLSSSLIITGGNLNIPGQGGGGSSVDFNKPFADMGKQATEAAPKGLFTGVGQSLLDSFKAEIDKFTAGLGIEIDLGAIQSSIEPHFNDILGAVVTVAGLVFGGPIGLAIGAARLIATAINENFLGIKDFLDESGITDAVTTALTGVRDTVSGLIDSIFNGGGGSAAVPPIDFRGVFPQDDKEATGPLATFVSDLSLGLNELKNLIETVWANIAPGVDSIAQGIKGFVSNLEGTETGGLLRIVTAIVGVIGGIADAIIRVGSEVFGAALTAIGNALPAIGSAINDFITALSNLGEGDIEGFVSGLANSLIQIGQSILAFIGVDIQIPDFSTAIEGWQTFFDSVGLIISTAVTNIQRDLDTIAVAIRTSFRDIEEIASRAQILGADANTLLGRGGTQNEANKAAATASVQASELARQTEGELTTGLASGDVTLDPSKFIGVDYAALAKKIVDPTLIKDSLNAALAEGDENAISVLLPLATELGIDTQSIIDQFAESLVEAGNAQTYQASLTTDVTVGAGKVDLGPLRGAINAAIANGNLAGGVPSQGLGGGAGFAAPHAASGANIKSDGLVYAHTGEIIENRAQQQAAGGGNAQAVSVTLNSDKSAEQLVQELKRLGIDLYALANQTNTLFAAG